jgi:2-polyprenyl-6-methoxyphenol hydroxylase-like FAD-dependent oxidoreductase
VLPTPWHKGRVLLVGDAAHPTTPQLASGAGLAAEDGLVLADELDTTGSIPEAFAAFEKRREQRCRMVGDGSSEIGRLERAGAPPAAQTAIVEQVLALLMEHI